MTTTQKLEQSDFEDHPEAGSQTLKARLWITEDQRCRSNGCQEMVTLHVENGDSEVSEGQWMSLSLKDNEGQSDQYLHYLQHSRVHCTKLQLCLI